MPEPTTTAAGLATIAGGAASATALTVLGVPLGLRADLLIAGFAGSLVAIIDRDLDGVPPIFTYYDPQVIIDTEAIIPRLSWQRLDP